jgi:Tfp pilus assembly protein PilN
MPAFLGRHVYQHVAADPHDRFQSADEPSGTLRALQSQLVGTQSVQRGLMSRQKLTTVTQKPAGTLQRHAWQPVLESLSRAMPPQVWLTELRYQPPALMMIGYASTLPALCAAQRWKLAGFTPGPEGSFGRIARALDVHAVSEKRGVARGDPVRTLV